LLDRLRYYEDLLKQNGVVFQPLHASSTPSAQAEERSDSLDQEETRARSSSIANTKNAQAKYAKFVTR
jgi:hypothetical protein